MNYHCDDLAATAYYEEKLAEMRAYKKSKLKPNHKIPSRWQKKMEEDAMNLARMKFPNATRIAHRILK